MKKTKSSKKIILKITMSMTEPTKHISNVLVYRSQCAQVGDMQCTFKMYSAVCFQCAQQLHRANILNVFLMFPLRKAGA